MDAAACLQTLSQGCLQVSWAINLPYGMHEADRSLAVQLLGIELSQSDGWKIGVLQKRISELSEPAGPEQTSEWLAE